jgi:hypothetical protein
MKKPIAPYLKVRGQLSTFTIINCEHKGFLKYIGHTAILYKDPMTGQLMLFESTTLNKFTGLSGVQMMPFGAWLARYPGKVFARVPEFDKTTTPINDESFRMRTAATFIKEHLGTSYPNLKTRTGRFKLYMASLDFECFGWDLFTYTGTDEGIFCTMLIIMMLQKCGLLATMYEPKEYEPDDTRDGMLKFEYHLINVKYLPEIRLK